MGSGGFGIGRASRGKSSVSSAHIYGKNQSHRKTYDLHVKPLALIGKLKEAEPILLLLVQAQTTLAEVYRDLAQLELQRNNPKQAKEFQNHWLELESNNPEILCQQAQDAKLIQRNDLALDRYSKLLLLNPLHTSALEESALLQLKNERWTKALALLNRRMELPKFENLYFSLAAFASLEINNAVRAASFAHSCLDNPNTNPYVHNENSNDLLAKAISLAILSRLNQDKGNEDQALEHGQQALQLASGQWPVDRILTKVYLAQQKLFDVSLTLEPAIRHEPNSVILHLQKAELLWHKGEEMWQGFKEFEWRNKLPKSIGNELVNDLPRFSGIQTDEPIALYCDGRMGDTFLFLRYAIWMKNVQGLNPILYVQKPLIKLLQQNLSPCIPVENLQERRLQTKGCYLPLLSAPAIFGTVKEHPELSKTCIKADPILMAHWRELLEIQPGEILIGINWHGSALLALSEQHVSDIPLRLFSPLTELPGVRFVSLQKGTGSHELKNCDFQTKFVTCQKSVSNEIRLEHIAAIISLCDWIVADDSGPAHLAGCLGIPSFVLLPERCNWRWASLSNTSPWYPNTRLLRSKPGQNWQVLVEQAKQLIALEFNLN